MATVKTPILSLAATGTIGRAVTMSKWKTVKTARSYRPPTNRNTPAQQAHRNRYSLAVAFASSIWGLPGIKDAWNRLASITHGNLSGWNLLIRDLMF